MKGKNRARWLLAALLFLHFALGLFYSLVVPIWEAYDEIGHYAFVYFIATRGRLPAPGERVVEHHDETHQPPLYYILCALATSWIDVGEKLEYVRNPYFGRSDGAGGQNFAVHFPEEAFPYKGIVLAVHVARLVSVALSTAVVWITYHLARSAFPERETLVWGATAITAFWPQLIFNGSVITNDIMITFFASLLFLFLVRVVWRPFSWKNLLGLGVALAGALLSKSNALPLLPLALVGMGVAFFRFVRGGRVKAWIAIAVVVLFLIPPSLWYYRNLSMRGTLIPHRPDAFPFLDMPSKGPEFQSLRWEKLPEALDFLFYTAWASFGWGNVAPDPRGLVYKAVTGLLLIGAIGLLLFIYRSIRAKLWEGPGLVGFLVLCLLVVISAPMYSAMQRGDALLAPGRYALPAICPFSVLLFLGLESWLPSRLGETWRKGLALLLGGGMFVFSALAPFVYILPAYAPPPLLSEEEAQNLPNPLHINFGGKAELLGYKLSAEKVKVGGALGVTLYWRALAPMKENYTVAVKVLGQGRKVYGEMNVYPGRGNYATSLWRPGDVFRDVYILILTPDMPAPCAGQIYVALFHDGVIQEHLSAYDPSGRTLGESAIFGRLKIKATHSPRYDIENPIYYNLGGKVALIGYEDATSPSEEEMCVKLYWKALEDVEKDYTVFAHLLDAKSHLISQKDGPPQGGEYPTGLWEKGEIVPDVYCLSLPEGLPKGELHLVVGMYLLETMERLPVFDEEGKRVPEDRIVLDKPFALPYH